MGCYETINFKIEGQTKLENGKRLVRAALETVCASYNLELTEEGVW